jgi:hypothetical protein
MHFLSKNLLFIVDQSIGSLTKRFKIVKRKKKLKDLSSTTHLKRFLGFYLVLKDLIHSFTQNSQNSQKV